MITAGARTCPTHGEGVMAAGMSAAHTRSLTVAARIGPEMNRDATQPGKPLVAHGAAHEGRRYTLREGELRRG
jgi:hypothetical protein